jgi:hypothetical protein
MTNCLTSLPQRLAGCTAPSHREAPRTNLRNTLKLFRPYMIYGPILHTAAATNFDIHNCGEQKLISNLCFICTYFFDVKLPEDDLKTIETCRSISGSYVTAQL